jgi:hypothetical protein
MARNQEPARICRHVRPDGRPCQANAINGSSFCFFHDPAKAEARQGARSAGGRKHRAATLAATVPDLPLKTVGDVSELLALTINHVRRGELDPRVGNCVGYLAGVLLKALEQGDIETRLSALEVSVNRPRRDEPAMFDVDPVEVHEAVA